MMVEPSALRASAAAWVIPRRAGYMVFQSFAGIVACRAIGDLQALFSQKSGVYYRGRRQLWQT